MTNLPIVWLPSSNYTAGRQGRKPTLIILHTTEGSYDSALSWLRGAAGGSSNRTSSAHYLVSADGKRVAQLVKEEDTAWTAGNWDYNLRSINIEQEGWAGRGGFSDGLYATVGALVGQIATRWGIPLDRAHVIGHADVPNQTHWDPGPHYDFNRVLARARQEQTPVPEPDVIYIEATKKHLGHGFLALWRQLEAAGNQLHLRVLGYPLTEEFRIPNIYAVFQVFERGILKYDAAAPDPWKVHVCVAADNWIRDWAKDHGLM